VDGTWSQDVAVRAAVQADLAGQLARLQSAQFQTVA
jgi:hypothetical protein